MKTIYVKDSGVCFAKCPQAWLFLSSRKLYRSFIVWTHVGPPDEGYIKYSLSGCALRRCKFPTLTCNKCCFNY